ncbi:MAG: patatin-like phospholipase family protein [Sphaerochaetaceae bacterium]|jgi:predicted acylesterase/phospholipase RssA|nr:patatin-like phospholipase family protein [Sphaerochaetaceae bacterium]
MRNAKTPSIDEIRLQNAEPRHNEAEDCFILSLDGGGMRGIISTEVLEGFCQILKDKGENRPLVEVFDMVAGTSTGGLIASAMTCPSLIGRTEDQGPALMDPGKLGDIYKVYGSEIFGEPVPRILNAVSDKFSPRKLESLLKLWFKDTRFSSCVIPTLIMGYDVTAGVPFPMASTENKELFTWEVGRCTSAAPTYFPAFQLGNQLIVDGGVIANNPSLYAYRYARSLWPKCKRFHILSISTCSSIYRYNSLSTYGIASWTSIYKVYANAQQQTTDEMMECLPDVDYLRIYKEMGARIEMDDARDQTISQLETYGKELFLKNKTVMESFADRIIAAQKPIPTAEVETSMAPIQRRTSFLQKIKKWVRRMNG